MIEKEEELPFLLKYYKKHFELELDKEKILEWLKKQQYSYY